MKKLTILVDLDDTLTDFIGTWVEYLNNRYGKKVLKSDVTQWGIHNFFKDIYKDQVYEVLREPEFWDLVQPKNNAAKYMMKLINDGHKLVIVTASHHETISMKYRQVLFKHFPFIQWDDVIVASQKQLILGDILIDDAPHNHIGGKYRGILVDEYHNHDFNELEHGIIRAKNWREIYSAVCKISYEMRNIIDE